MNELKIYYKNYYNNNCLRDVFSLKPLGDPYSLRGNDYGDNHENNLNKFLDFLMNRYFRYRKNGLFGARIGYYKTASDFQEYKIDTIYSDRLFFDFDVEDDRIKPLKEELTKVNKTWSPNPEGRPEIWAEYQRLILEENLLKKPFDEAKRLCDYLQKCNLKTYLAFSGSKGFHCNLFFPELKLTKVKQITTALSESWSKQLNLTCLDTAVYTKRTALQRIPYTTNEKTGLYCLPLPTNITYEDTLELIAENDPTPHDFNIGDYYPPEGFTEMLLRMNEHFIQQEKEEKIKQQLNDLKMAKKGKYSKNIFGKVNMKTLVRAIAPEREDPPGSNQYHCLFHKPDVHQSAVAFDDNYYCHTCDRTWSAYDLIKDYYNCKTKQQVINKFKEIQQKIPNIKI